MEFSRRTLAAAAAIALTGGLLATPALAQKKYDPGASDAEIVLGMPMPLSGPVSGYAIVGKVAEGYFKRLNEQGGINGRKVKLLIYDDQYSPPKTVEVARRMVEQEEILAMFGNLGTAPNAAIQRYMNTKKVPQLFVQSGAAQFNDSAKNPWTTPFLASYQGEGRVFAKQILASKPNAKVAMLLQNDDLGREVLRGLQEGLKDKGATLVGQATFEVSDPTVDSQMVQLKATGADVLVVSATARTVAQAIRKASELGWDVERYVNFAGGSVKMAMEPAGVDKAKGTFTLAAFKEPMGKRWAEDPAVQAYHALLKQYVPGADPGNSSGVQGYIAAQLMHHILTECGDNLTRENVRKIASNLKNPKIDLLLPGVTINTSSADLHAYATLQPVRYNGVDLDPVGPVLSVK